MRAFSQREGLLPGSLVDSGAAEVKMGTSRIWHTRPVAEFSGSYFVAGESKAARHEPSRFYDGCTCRESKLVRSSSHRAA